MTALKQFIAILTHTNLLIGSDNAMRGPGARLHQGGDTQVHGAQARLYQGFTRLPQVS
jgi:hypothetical protein